MYTIKGDGVTIYNDVALTESLKAISPKLTLKDNAAGSLELTLPVGNAGYDTLARMKSVITVYRHDEEIWSGRIVSERIDFQNNRVLTCEGEMAYLNDTIQPPKKYEAGTTVLAFLQSILDIHNQNAGDAEKNFYVGESYIFNYNVELPEICTNYENTLECISTNLLEPYGGHMSIRKDEDGKRYLWWFSDEQENTNTQVIRFGQNLLDFSKNWDLSELATVIIPRGKQLEKSDISEDIEAYVTVEGVNDEEVDTSEIEDVSKFEHSGIYVKAIEPCDTYGRIEKTVDFEDISDPNELLIEAYKYLEKYQFNEMTLEVSAVDLHYFNVDAESIRIGDYVRCISRPHGLSDLFPVSELTIQLDKPDSAQYTLGTTENGTTLTSANSQLSHEVEQIPNKSTMLTLAKQNADKLINESTNGFVSIRTNTKDGRHSEAVIISSERITSETPLESVKHYWIWNINGLAHYSYSKPETDETKLDLAMTMDGAIVANKITVGTMSADRIRTGMLMSEDGNVVWNLNNAETSYNGVDYAAGSLTIKKGSIALGEKFGNWDGTFCVNDDGVMRASKGTIGGFTIDSYSIYNDVIELDSRGLAFHYIDAGSDKRNTLGTYGTNSWDGLPSIKGLTVDMEYETNYIAWGYRESSTAQSYSVKLMYVSKAASFEGYTADSLNAGCDLYMGTHSIRNGWIDPNTLKVNTGITDRDVLLPLKIDDAGTVQEWLLCSIKNGYVVK